MECERIFKPFSRCGVKPRNLLKGEETARMKGLVETSHRGVSHLNYMMRIAVHGCSEDNLNARDCKSATAFELSSERPPVDGRRHGVTSLQVPSSALAPSPWGGPGWGLQNYPDKCL